MITTLPGSRPREATSGQPPRMNSRRRTKASVGPEGRTERSKVVEPFARSEIEQSSVNGGRES